MAESAWRRRCRPLIAEALAALPTTLTRRECHKALQPLYPWVVRRNHPYTMWLKEVRSQLDERFAPMEPDVTLNAAGPLCRWCEKAHVYTPSNRCLACLPAWGLWDAVDAGLREDFAVLMQARKLKAAGADAAARDFSEEYMGGIKLEGK